MANKIGHGQIFEYLFIAVAAASAVVMCSGAAMMADGSDAGVSGYCGDDLTWELEDRGHTLVIRGSGAMEDCPFFSFKEGRDHTVEKVELPQGLTRIGESAFTSFCKLRQITIPGTVESIGDFAFEDCESLISIAIPESVGSIGRYVFDGCRELREINVDPDNDAYCSEKGILFSKDRTVLIRCPMHSESRSVFVPCSVEAIGEYAFEGCKEVRRISISDSVESIGYAAFSDCSELRSINISKSVESIEELAFDGCRKLREINVDPDNNVYSSQKGILFSKDGTVFIRCPSSCILTSVSIPRTVETIYFDAFWDCSQIRYISIPASVVSIGHQIFDGCRELRAIDADPENTAYCSENGILFNKDKTTIIRCPMHYEWESVTIPQSVVCIGFSAFAGCAGLKSIVVPDCVTHIQNDAFSGCRGLTSLSLPRSLATLTGDAFEGCDSLEKVYNYSSWDSDFIRELFPKGTEFIDCWNPEADSPPLS